MRYLPRVVALLDGTPQKKAAIRSIFLSVIAPPAHFSSINSLRTRSDSLSPVELMLFLHQHDKEIGLKHTIEGERLSSNIPLPAHPVLTRGVRPRNSHFNLLLNVRRLPTGGARGFHAAGGRCAENS